MDKEEVIKKLKELNLPKDEYYVLSGASLVLRGIREQCSDIDLCISEELLPKMADSIRSILLFTGSIPYGRFLTMGERRDIQSAPD